MSSGESKITQEEMEIDLGEVLFVLLRKILWLLAGLAAGVIISFGVTKILITPQYTASSMIYIFTKTTSITSLADLQIGSQLTVDFQTLGTSRPVVEKVIRDLNLDASYEELLKTITITNPSNSRILKISVENPDPRLAADISNAMADSLSSRVAEVLNTDKPSTVERAVVPSSPSSPNTLRNVAVGGLLGLVFVAAFVLLQHFMDDTIKSEEDVRKYLELNTLAAVPLEHAAGKSIYPGAVRPPQNKSLPGQRKNRIRTDRAISASKNSHSVKASGTGSRQVPEVKSNVK